MKTTFPTEVPLDQVLPDSVVEELMADDMLPEYEIDYSKTRPNLFARRENVPELVRLDADVAAVFQTAEAVNTALRTLMQTMLPAAHRETV